ncbi:c-type cytochrome [Rhodoferax sp.]|uniref:c-type cytochrome n=1 Tax=Rhodoferax sp. TaxID=50421 RepID=UPI00272183E1|nr:c-type cytochrome [Rhodoferax sp.]MDO9195295.1 c-type cytochrome [Rhodoferax sp.]
MSRFRKAVLATALLAVAGFASAQTASPYPGVGRAATPKEIAAWDIDVRPDFKGLPAGSGTVAKGQDVWESKCSHCHGIFGESGEVFSPLVGGVTPEDIKNGRVANLINPAYPGRTTLMKVPTVSTLWDYINRAMPWTAPKSLTTEEVYAVTAFLLNLGGIVPDNFTLSDKNIREVQERMPNRNGMTTKHSMWPGNEFGGAKKSDTSNVACMKDCAPEPKVASFLPDFARNAHGNLAEQNRPVGAQHGVDTTRPEVKRTEVKQGVADPAPAAAPAAPAAVVAQAKPAAAPKAEAAGVDNKAALALTQKNNCTACHAIDKKILGPSFMDIAKKHAGKVDYLAGKIKSGGSGVWGPIPMPAQALSEAEAKTIGAWLAAGAGK